jgi:hypothetical protein
MAVVGDVAHGEASDFATARAGVPGDGDERGVPAVVRRLDHGQDVLLPVEHVAGVRRGVVVAGGARRDPLDALRWVVAVLVSRSPAEHAECDPVVLVGLLVVVGVVDPANEVLRRLAVLERVGETTDVLGHSRAVPQELEVPVVAVLRLQQIELVTEIEQRVAVLVGHLLGFPDSVP